MLRTTNTENGKVSGLPGSNPRITAYLGIPFAAPPVGKNRWRAPQPAESWEGVRLCHEFGPISYQNTPGMGTDIYCREWHVDADIPMSEDCLYLNVWTPAKAADEKLPVLVWFFGGGFQWGYTAEMEFNGEALAKKGVVVVSVAYRLNCFGFMAHPEITKESPDAPANFGLLDQKAGLHWVYRNIANFGGDPEKITIAGQSAGGSSVMHQYTHEGNFDVIKGAVVLSGIIRLPDPKDDIFRPLDLPKAEELGKAFLDSLGVKSLDEAREIDSKSLLAGYDEFVSDHPRMFPIRDGFFCKGDPVELFVEGKCAKAPIIAGNTSDEFMMGSINTVEQSVKSTFNDATKKRADQSCYYYRFDPDIPGDGNVFTTPDGHVINDSHPGTFHSCDLWFFFDNLIKCHRPYEGRHFELARQMSDYFANFIKTGDPNKGGSEKIALPVWAPYTDSDRNEMEFISRGASPRKEGGIRNNCKKQAVNPYLPNWEYVPDGEPYVFGNRVYVYGSHDIYGGETFCMGDYVCWSAPVNDLGNWHYEGVIYRKTQDPLNEDGHMCLYAPDVTQGPDGRYYLYYVLDKISVVSVAVSDCPNGPFEFYGYVHYEDGTKLGDKKGDEPQFDPGVLTEGDEVHLYTGFCGHGDESRHGAMYTLLDKDMLTVRKAPEIVVPGKIYSAGTGYEGHAFFEASSIRKKDDTYYFIYSSEVMHELCYATSDKPAGPFTYGGVLVSNCDLHIGDYKAPEVPSAYGGNNHGSMIQIGDEWYIFYHRHTNGTWFSRQACAEKLHINEDGSIDQAEITSCGLNGGPLEAYGEYPSYIACNIFTRAHKMYVEPDAPRVVQEFDNTGYGISYIKDIVDGTAVGFKYFNYEHVTGLRIKTRGYFKGHFDVTTSLGGEVIGTIVKDDSSNIWDARECHFEEINGIHALYLRYNGSGSCSLATIEFLKG